MAISYDDVKECRQKLEKNFILASTSARNTPQEVEPQKFLPDSGSDGDEEQEKSKPTENPNVASTSKARTSAATKATTPTATKARTPAATKTKTPAATKVTTPSTNIASTSKATTPAATNSDDYGDEDDDNNALAKKRKIHREYIKKMKPTDKIIADWTIRSKLNEPVPKIDFTTTLDDLKAITPQEVAKDPIGKCSHTFIILLH